VNININHIDNQYHIWLVVSPLKNMSQLGYVGIIIPKTWKNKNVPNYQPDI
jgi:hypothetical protein